MLLLPPSVCVGVVPAGRLVLFESAHKRASVLSGTGLCLCSFSDWSLRGDRGRRTGWAQGLSARGPPLLLFGVRQRPHPLKLREVEATSVSSTCPCWAVVLIGGPQPRPQRRSAKNEQHCFRPAATLLKRSGAGQWGRGWRLVAGIPAHDNHSLSQGPTGC